MEELKMVVQKYLNSKFIKPPKITRMGKMGFSYISAAGNEYYEPYINITIPFEREELTIL